MSTIQARPLDITPTSRLVSTKKNPSQRVSNVPKESKQYPGFYYNIRLYELGNLFNIEKKEKVTHLSRIVPKISWGLVLFISLSLTINLVKLLWKNFSADKQVVANLVICLGYLPKIFLNLSNEEIASAKYYYNKAYPEKQLPLVFWLPFDDTVAPNYYFMAVVNIYCLMLIIILAFGLISNISTFSIHIKGQYQMLAVKLKRAASWSDLKSIIQQHQKLEEFRRNLATHVGTTCLLKMFIYNLTISLLMYEFTAVNEVNQGSIQVVFEWVVLLIMFYSFTTSSEYIDEGNDILCNTLRSYKWYNVTDNWYIWYNESDKWYKTHNFNKDGLKALQLFTNMCNKPKRMIYYGGVVDISNHLFLTVLKLSYSLFTIMKHSIHAKQ
ncbi:hypothetical protein WDU94_008276 [Cyamophila willieti]